MSKKLLLVEPDKVLANNVSQFFKKQGYQVSWASSAQSGIEKTDSFEPDVIVLDLQLGGHSGIEFLHELRSYGDWQDLPVVVYTSIHSDALGGEELAKTGLTIAAYIHKPRAGLKKLASAVESAIKTSHEV